MTDREKLIELLGKAARCDEFGVEGCETCRYRYEADCNVRLIVDHLLVNGVTFATDTNDGYKWISVEDRLPEIISTTRAGRNTYRRSARVLCACLQADGKRFVKEGYMEFFNDYPEPNWRIPGTIHSVTHWMPMPTWEEI